MAISGISGNYNYWQYQNMVSQTRLSQALAKNPKIQKMAESIGNTGTTGTTDYSSSMNFLKSYNSTMTSLADAANSLREANSSGAFSNLSVSSSDTSIAEVTDRLPLRTEKDMSLTVSQLAAEQKNVSTEVESGAAAADDMNFTVTGAYTSKQASVNVSSTDAEGNARTNIDMLKEAASQINSQKAGVTASVTEKDGKASLVIQGDNTGMQGAFDVSGNMGAADGAQNVQTQAQNAEYSVTENGQTRDYASSSNKVVLGTGRVNATLKSEGTSNISIQADSEKIASAMSNLVDKYNNALTLLNKNADRGSGVIRQIRSFASDLTSDKTMAKLGLSTNKDGTLALDKDTLTNALKEDPKFTKSLISDSYGVAQKAFNRATGAMNTSSSSLINNDLAQKNASQYSAPYDFMNAFSKAGANNLSNYYAMGMFVNYLA